MQVISRLEKASKQLVSDWKIRVAYLIKAQIEWQIMNSIKFLRETLPFYTL